jgi:hypothetical protein
MSELPAYGASVRDTGARGDGTGDDAPAFEKLLQQGESLIVVPPGEYALARPIRMRSRTRLLVHPSARIRIADGAEWGVRDALVTNADWETGDQHIEISGGTWDGNNPNVHRAAEDERDGYTGNLILFRNVEHLVLKDMKLTDPSSYFVCLGKVRKFRIEDIRFEILHHTRNQDGIHVSGHCEDGIIRNISGTGKYCPGDDLVALNADDALDRSETRSALAGPIRRICVSRLRAEDCHAFMRFASVWSTIEDINVHDVEGGCVDVAVNADALRFCRSPLFEVDDPQFANGCGDLRNIHLSKFRVYKTRNLDSGLLQFHSRMNNLVVEDFQRVLERDINPAHPTFDLGFIPGTKGRIDGFMTNGREDLLNSSTSVKWDWRSFVANKLGHPPLSAEFSIPMNARLKGHLRELSRLAVETCPMHPLPTPDWNKGMTR